MDNDACVVLVTAGSVEEADRLASALVEERLAACVSIVDAVRSVYRWQGRIEKAAETLLIIKTAAERFEAARRRIRELHSYDTPEIIAFRVEAGDDDYLAWLRHVSRSAGGED